MEKNMVAAVALNAEFHGFITNVTPFFLIVYAGNTTLVRKLLLLLMWPLRLLFRSIVVQKLYDAGEEGGESQSRN